MAFNVFKDVFTTVDQATATFVHDISTRCIVEITPVLTVALTLSFIGYGLLIMRGAVDISVSEFLGKSFRIAIILNIALMGGLYQSEIAGLIRTIPNDLATALIARPDQGASAACLIDEAARVGFDCAGMAFDKAGIFSFEGLTYCLIGIVICCMTAILLAVGAAFLLMSKLALSILAGLGPLFIVSLLFPATERFFSLWLSQVLNYVLLVVLYASVFGLMMNIYKTYMTSFVFDGIINISHALGGVCILSFAMLIVLRQLPAIATSLAGGVALSFKSNLRMPKFSNPPKDQTVPSLPSQGLPSPANDFGAPRSSGAQIIQMPKPYYGYYRGQNLKAANSK